MIKIAFFDVDGTILQFSHKEPTDKVKEALLKLKQNGVLLCMATGRSFPCLPHFYGIDFDILLTFNGSYIVYKDKIIRNNPLSTNDVQTLIKNISNMNRGVAIASTKCVLANGYDTTLEEYFNFGSAKLVVSDDFDNLSKQDIYQVMCSATKEEYEEILKGTTNAKITAWWDKAVDIVPKDGGKGEAVKDILNYLGISKQEAIAFGDGYNDVEMFYQVGTSVAMGNANEEVKKHATDVCKSCDEDGVYYYCLDKKLIY